MNNNFGYNHNQSTGKITGRQESIRTGQQIGLTQQDLVEEIEVIEKRLRGRLTIEEIKSNIAHLSTLLEGMIALTFVDSKGHSLTFKAITGGPTTSKSMLFQIVSPPVLNKGETLEEVLIEIFNHKRSPGFTSLVEIVADLNIYRLNKGDTAR